jgi:hypothetical protein
MQKKDLPLIAVIVIISAVISSILANIAFTSPKHRTESAPVVPVISSSFPDVQNDDQYKSIFNTNALDPTQLIQIGTSQNTAPFNSP